MDAGNRADLVDLVQEDDAGLRAVHVVVGVLQELPDDGLDVVADVAGHGERGAVADGERHVQAPGDRLWWNIDKIISTSMGFNKTMFLNVISLKHNFINGPNIAY